MIGPAHHIGVAVRRLDEALADYLESLSPEGVIARFIERRGEGLHHLAFSVRDIREEMRRLRGQGLELIDAEPRPGAHGRLVAFLHPRSARGVLLELVQESP